mgnify:CR=1 FL=1
MISIIQGLLLQFEHLKEGEGNSTYRNRIIDAIYHMDGNTLEETSTGEKLIRDKNGKLIQILNKDGTSKWSAS